MQIYIAEGTQQTGPFDLETVRQGLQSGRYSPTQLAWYEGAPGWDAVSKVPGLELSASAPAPPPPASVPPPMPVGAVPVMTAPGYAPPPAGYVPPPTGAPDQYVAPSYPSTSGGAPAKSFASKLGGGVLAVLFGLLFIVKVTRPFWNYTGSHRTSSSSSPAATPSPSASALFTYMTPSFSAPPGSSPLNSPPGVPSLPAGLRTATYYNNANQFASGELLQHYVNFRFNYPNDLTLVSGTKVAHKEDFVEADHSVEGRSVETFYVEDFFTGENAGLAAVLPTVGPKFFESLHASAKKQNPAVQLVSQGLTRFKNYAAYEYRSMLPTQDRAGHPFSVYTHYVIVAPSTGKNGVILEIVATSDTPGLRKIDDITRTAYMAPIWESFTFL